MESLAIIFNNAKATFFLSKGRIMTHPYIIMNTCSIFYNSKGNKADGNKRETRWLNRSEVLRYM